MAVNTDYSNEILVSDLKAGSHTAFKIIYDHYYSKIYAVAFKYLKEENMAEDAVQEIFIKLWVNRQNLDVNLTPRGFLFKCLKFHVLNTIRNQSRVLIKQYEIAYHTPAFHKEVEEDLLLKESIKDMEQAIEKLSPQKKLIFKLRTVEGLNNDQVSKKLGLSINTVKFQFSQASKALRKYMKLYSHLPMIIFLICYKK